MPGSHSAQCQHLMSRITLSTNCYCCSPGYDCKLSSRRINFHSEMFLTRWTSELQRLHAQLLKTFKKGLILLLCEPPDSSPDYCLSKWRMQRIFTTLINNSYRGFVQKGLRHNVLKSSSESRRTVFFFTAFLRDCSRIPTAASEASKSNQKASKRSPLPADRWT